jgi:hypothetical protein
VPTMPVDKSKPPVEKEKDLPLSHVRVVTINDDEEVTISEDATQDYYIHDVAEVNESAFKCSGCQLLTVHSGIEFIIASVGPEPGTKPRRVYVCSNCGKAGLK